MGTVQLVDDIQGILVKVGLRTPIARAFVVGSVAAGIAYIGGYPRVAFREDGSMKPLKYLSPEPDATFTHFLLVPATAAAIAFIFT